MENPTYDYGKGPINIKVVDPLNLEPGYFECKFNKYTAPSSGNGADTASWTIYRYANKGDANPAVPQPNGSVSPGNMKSQGISGFASGSEI